MASADLSGLEPLLIELETTAREHSIPICGRNRGMFLYRLVKEHQPSRVVEVGAAIGYSTILLAHGASENGRGQVTTIEIRADAAEETRRNLARAGLASLVSVMLGDATEVLHALTLPIDFLFLDAEKAHYIDYFKAAEPHLVEGAVLVADNVGRFPDQMAAYLEEVRRRFESHTQEFPEDKMEVSIYRRP